MNQRKLLRTPQIVFHVGLHKTGTTWLPRGYFSEHPEITMLSKSEEPWNDRLLNYLIQTREGKFNPENCRKMLFGLIKKYSQENLNYVISAERLSGHPFSGGYGSFKIADRIKLAFPESKIIIVLRNQEEMLLSVYRQLVLEGYMGKFKDLINSVGWKTPVFSKGFFEYDLLVEKYISLFGKNNILILFFEELKISPNNFVAKINNFINLSSFQPSNINIKAHLTPDIRFIRAQRVVNKFRKSEYNMFPFVSFSNYFQRYLKKVISLFLVFFKDNHEFNTDWIRDYYSESNLRLGLLEDKIPQEYGIIRKTKENMK